MNNNGCRLEEKGTNLFGFGRYEGKEGKKKKKKQEEKKLMVQMVEKFVCTSSTPLALLTHLEVGTVDDENKENSCVSGKELFATRDRERSFFWRQTILVRV